MFAALEAKLATFWRKLDGEARAEVEKALADAKAEEAKLAPLLTQFKADLEAAVVAAEPGLKTTLEGLAAKLLADAGAVIPGL